MFNQITDKFDSILRNLRGLGKITDSNIEQAARDIRRLLLEADVNFKVAKSFIARVVEKAQGTKVIKSVKPGEQFIKIIHDELVELLGSKKADINFSTKGPSIFLLAGLQGSGKTTTCAKLAKYLQKQNHTVLLTAADMIRPAAVDQLQVLGQSIGIEVYSEKSGNPVDICVNAVQYGAEKGFDVIILDTAGRLHVDPEMMSELHDISQVVNPIETLFVVDGMTGQDAVNSAMEFDKILELTGTILTKMDGDARGGAAISITEVLGKPVKFIGVSEKPEGLEIFDPERIVNRILGLGDILSLVEKAQKIVDTDEAIKLQEKIKKNSFDLEDFKNQLVQIQKMGPIQEMMGMIPGINRKTLKGLNVDDRQLKWTEAIISSMTKEEKSNPNIISGSRRSRIANGSGRTVQEVNQLLKQFTQMQKMFRKMSKFKTPHFPGMGKGMGKFIGLS